MDGTFTRSAEMLPAPVRGCPDGDPPFDWPGLRMLWLRAARWSLALCVASAAVAALPVPAGAASEEALERVMSLVAEGRLGEARELLDPVLESGVNRPRARLLDGILLARAGDVGEAIDVFDRLRREYPEMPEPWNNLAVLFAVKGRLLDARSTLEEAIVRQPDLAAAHANLGDVYAALARHSRTKAAALRGPLAGGANPVRGAKDAPVAGAGKPAASIPLAPSRLAPAAGDASSSPATVGSLQLAAPAPAPASAPVPASASASASASAPASGGVGVGGDGSRTLAKTVPVGKTRAARDQWQSFLSLPGASAPGSPAPAAAPAASAAPSSSASGVSPVSLAQDDSSRRSGSAPFTCFVVSGFESSGVAAEAEAWLFARGVSEVEPRLTEPKSPTNHRVYLPPMKSREEAVATVYELRERGIRDVAIISAGPLRNGVSLGVYRNAKNALRRVARIEGLGYPVRHAPGETGEGGYALAVRAAGDAFPPLRAAWMERFPDRPLVLAPAECG